MKNTTQWITGQTLSFVSVVKLWNMSLQNAYLTIWKNNSLLYDVQHGFRHSRSCETQLLSFVQELTSNSDKNIQTDLIIIDFAKAFDKVPHQRLLCKLKFHGIKNGTLSWISAFLSNRTQTVVLNGESSDIASHCWCPTGNSCGPCPFSGIYKWFTRRFEIQPTQTVCRRQHNLQNYQIPKGLW